MRRIQIFKSNPFWVILLLISMPLIVVVAFELVEFENNRWLKWIAAFGFILQAVYFSRMFWYKNYVEWNKHTINIRINRSFALAFNYRLIRSVEIKDNHLIIDQDRKIYKLDLENIDDSDVDQLVKLIQTNSCEMSDVN